MAAFQEAHNLGLKFSDPDAYKALLDFKNNPEGYTTQAPNEGAQAAFTQRTVSGAGRDGTKYGTQAYYKIDQDNDAANAFLDRKKQDVMRRM